jgi:hypothetical protein
LLEHHVGVNEQETAVMILNNENTASIAAKHSTHIPSRLVPWSTHFEVQRPVLIIGAGLAGVYVAKILHSKGIPFHLVEKSARIGGIWSSWANNTSRLQINGVSYECLSHRTASSSSRRVWNSAFPSGAEILSSAQGLLEGFTDGSPGSSVSLNTTINSIRKSSVDSTVKYLVSGSFGGVEKQLEYSAVMCLTGGLHSPSTMLPIPGLFSDFRGKAFLGIANDIANDISCAGFKDKHVVIYGHGAFAIENMRTALENDCAHVTIVCRKKSLVMTSVVNWVLDSSKEPVSVNVLLSLLQPFYQLIGQDVYQLSCITRDESNDYWFQQTTVPPTSDYYFLAQAAGKLTVIDHEEIDCFKSTEVITRVTQLSIPCDIYIQCHGFTYDTSFLSKLFPRESNTKNTELQGCWIDGDMNLFHYNDAHREYTTKVKSMICTSYLFFVQAFTNVFLYYHETSSLEAESDGGSSKAEQFKNIIRGLSSSYSVSQASAKEKTDVDVSFISTFWKDFIRPLKNQLSERIYLTFPFEEFYHLAEAHWEEVSAHLQQQQRSNSSSIGSLLPLTFWQLTEKTRRLLNMQNARSQKLPVIDQFASDLKSPLEREHIDEQTRETVPRVASSSNEEISSTSKLVMYSTVNWKKLRLLFLPGQGTSGSISYHILQQNGWISKLSNYLEFFIPNPLFIMAPFTNTEQLKLLGLDMLMKEGIYSTNSSCFEWKAGFDQLTDPSLPSDENREKAIWEQIFCYIHAVVKRYGPFDGIGGFCEGSAVGTTVLHLQSLFNANPSHPLARDFQLSTVKFYLNFSGWRPPVYERKGLFRSDNLCSVKSIHFVGQKDLPIFLDSFPLMMETYRFPKGYQHGFRHIYPPLSLKLENIIVDFLNSLD